MEALENAKKYNASTERLKNLNDLLLRDLNSLTTLYVDGSVLKTTGIAKSLQLIKNKKRTGEDQSHSSTSAAQGGVFSEDCVNLAADLIQKWKSQVRVDNRESTIRNLKGGNVLKM